MRYFILAILVIFSTAQAARAESGIGFKQIELPDEGARERLPFHYGTRPRPRAKARSSAKMPHFTVLRFNRVPLFLRILVRSCCCRTVLAAAGAI